MPRQRYQDGAVEKTDTKPQRWNGRYAVYVTEDGKEKRKSRETILGLVSGMTKEDAKEKLRSIIRAQTAAPSPGGMTLWEFMHKPKTGYIALRSPRWSPAWADTLEDLFRIHLEKSIGAKRLTDITRGDCQAWVNAQGGRSQSSIHKCRTQLCAILAEAYAQDLVEKNRAEELTEPKSKNKVKRPWMTPEQVARGLRVTLGYRSKREYLIFRLAVTRGLRPSEIFALRVNDLQDSKLMIDEGVVRNIVGDTKSKESAAPVVLTDDLRRVMEQYISTESLSGDDFLFTYSTGAPMSQNNYVRRQFKTLGAKIGVPDLNFRMTRRTFATHFKGHGDSKDLQSAMRHADATMSQEIYQQEIPEETIKAVESYEAKVLRMAAAA